MKIAYLVFAYKNPQLLNRVINRLYSDNCDFFIHIDKKVNMAPFAIIQQTGVEFTEKRIPVYWAEFSGVQAILLLIEAALRSAKKYDYLILLSGSEFPLRSKDYIEAFLAENRGSEFMSLVKMPNSQAGKPMSRINTLRFPSDKPVRRLAMRFLARLGMARRDFKKWFPELEPFGGHTWWALTRAACLFVLEFVKSHPLIVKYFEKTFAPEEMFFQTILGNSLFGARTRRNLVYEDWSSRGAHPAMISEKHLALFESEEKVIMEEVYGVGEVLFARKFCDEDLSIVARMEEMIRRKDRG